MKERIGKGIFSMVAAGVTIYFNKLAIPFVVFLFALCGDYITGMMKGFVTGELSSKRGLKGIIKKLGYIMLICVGIGADWVITWAISQFKPEIQAVFAVGLLITIWLIINELISILENLYLMRVPVLPFLMPLLKKLKVFIEAKGSDVVKLEESTIKESPKETEGGNIND